MAHVVLLGLVQELGGQVGRWASGQVDRLTGEHVNAGTKINWGAMGVKCFLVVII
jgi:hypothetical protein